MRMLEMFGRRKNTGGALSDFFEGLDRLIWGTIITLAICVPLAIWKLIEIIIWVCEHTTIEIK
ncbi:hypothetical protein CMI47_10970 [Candidatus Pacearchaeota archaeon]|nr:hypothetical protein [Candidatus Pacearchaeota archaeon]|tara:strand:- start:200 stop:388 length:189 start_codon:yes stop_codon:yes gene_type:complete